MYFWLVAKIKNLKSYKKCKSKAKISLKNSQGLNKSQKQKDLIITPLISLDPHKNSLKFKPFAKFLSIDLSFKQNVKCDLVFKNGTVFANSIFNLD